MKARCVLVSDELLVQDLLGNYVSRVDDLQLVHKAPKMASAKQFLENEGAEILLLDLESSQAGALDYLNAMETKPVTIVFSSTHEYALVGYQLGVIDYLLKPIGFDRFQAAINKALDLINERNGSGDHFGELELDWREALKELSSPGYFFVKADYKIVKVAYDEILYIESMREYVRIHTPERRVTTLLSLGKMMDMLPRKRFIKIHRSHIINLDKVDSIQGNMVYIGEQSLTISKSHKDDFFKQVEGMAGF